jgi:hypothetical protein
VCRTLVRRWQRLGTDASADIYLHPPDSTASNCKDWIRVRNVAGAYTVMFSEVRVAVSMWAGLSVCLIEGGGCVVGRTSRRATLSSRRALTSTSR